jgi:hypothetical protein
VIDVEQIGNHSDAQSPPLTIALTPDQLELLASRSADVLELRCDDCYVEVDGATAF